MSCRISSKNLNNPLLKELLRQLNDVFSSIDTDFYIIGATARDIILTGVHNQPAMRATNDLDITVAVSDWRQFDEIAAKIYFLRDFQKDKNQKQRFFFKDIYSLDIVPFGNIASKDGKIYWQPEEEIAMSVLGYAEAVKEILEVVVDDEFTIKVVQLPGIFIQKLNAFKDRSLLNNKDANDMAFIMENYLEINEIRAVEDYYEELYCNEDFDTFVAGSILLGKDIKKLFSDNKYPLDVFAEIIYNEINTVGESRLMMQILETHKSLKYEQVLKALQNIYKELIMR